MSSIRYLCWAILRDVQRKGKMSFCPSVGVTQVILNRLRGMIFQFFRDMISGRYTLPVISVSQEIPSFSHAKCLLQPDIFSRVKIVFTRKIFVFLIL